MCSVCVCSPNGVVCIYLHLYCTERSHHNCASASKKCIKSGVSKPPDETPEALEGWLTGLDNAIINLPRRTRTAYERATFLRPEIQSDVKFKLRFLRADAFNVENAAKRITNYFSQKLRLFGDDKLVKKLTLEDLQEHDIQILKTGCFIVVPTAEPMGRSIRELKIVWDHTAL